MQRLATLVIVGAVILSSIILTDVTPSAATEYLIKATAASSGVTNFTVTFIDIDADTLLSDPGQPDTVVDFTGVHVGGTYYDVLLHTPDVGLTAAPTAGAGGLDWWFGHTTLTSYDGLNAKYWSYIMETAVTPVPLPPGALLLGTGLLGLGALGWRRKRR